MFLTSLLQAGVFLTSKMMSVGGESDVDEDTNREEPEILEIMSSMKIKYFPFAGRHW